jgi:TseV toxin immunity protein TsiV
MRDHWPDFDPKDLTLEVDGRPVLVPCLEFVVYTDSVIDSSMLEFYERSLKALGGRITCYLAENMKRPAPLDANALKVVPTWLKRPRPAKSYYASFRGASEGVTAASLDLVIAAYARVNPTPKQIEERHAMNKKGYEQEGWVFAPPVSMLRVTLPLDHELSSPPRFLEWILGFPGVRSAVFSSGHAGLALNHDAGVSDTKIRDAASGRLAALCLRHPGLDWDNYGSVGSQLLRWQPDSAQFADPEANMLNVDFLPRIKRVNWLTFVSTKAVRYLGGLDKLRNKLKDPEITVHELAHGIAIQAGPAPRLGDVSRRDFLPVYRRVASVLRPMRLDKHGSFGRHFSDEAAAEWLDGLDREYD